MFELVLFILQLHIKLLKNQLFMKVKNVIAVFLTIPIFLLLDSCSSEGGAVFDCALTAPVATIASQTDASCSGNDGSFEITATGSSELSFVLGSNAPQSTGVFEGLSAGIYSVEVIDANNCATSVSVTIGVQGSDLSLSASANSIAGCGSTNGSITVSGTGGDGGYMFSLDGGDFQSDTEYSGLSAGMYDVLIKDASGCTTSQEVHVLSGTSFDQDVKPIFEANCILSNCHNGDRGESSNWSILSSVQSKADGIKSRTGAGTMPPASSGLTLTDEEVDLIACWVDDGALDN